MPGISASNGNKVSAQQATQEAISQWQKGQQPSSPTEWIARAKQVGDILAIDAVEREQAQAIPEREVQLLKESGLVTFLGPKQFGGAEGTWDIAYKLIREVSKADGSIGQLLGYHLVWFWHARVLFNDAEYFEFIENEVRNKSFFGGAVNPRDSDLKIKDLGSEISFSGVKSFSTGGRISDITVLEGVLEGTEDHIFAFVPTRQPGIQFKGDWDNLGQRLTESGGVVIDNVRTPWKSAAGWSAYTKKYEAIPYHSLTLPIIQLNFTNKYLGIAQGALEFARNYSATKTRAWPKDCGGLGHDKAVDEWYLQENYGQLYATLRAAEALIDDTGKQIAALAHAPRESVTAEQRAQVAVDVATAKLSIVDHGLYLTNKVFELTGARATANSVGLDRFWRNLRTHTLHDPIAYKKVEVGRYVLTGELPKPTWYT
ncbi:putative acyl-CoA dehydrogenase [Protomyces lactucae-debilis]|uniref:Putative acyl-CoA dehydrogenase n=1 Tax=Protomyces lactucae-debilis TaxID=2754530 RepID=A0A1Y2FAB8_PROLT|nr:putative acyl-CoA dehydrogenase [Protomyces lactucae-debilis]ORY80858.1 putative acyl-CoA dehydrogenase [Protomyces lactucae-debilis]